MPLTPINAVRNFIRLQPIAAAVAIVSAWALAWGVASVLAPAYSRLAEHRQAARDTALLREDAAVMERIAEVGTTRANWRVQVTAVVQEGEYSGIGCVEGQPDQLCRVLIPQLLKVGDTWEGELYTLRAAEKSSVAILGTRSADVLRVE